MALVLLCLLFLSIFSTALILLCSGMELIYPCDSAIYCRGPILEAVNRLGLYHDSKHYVDMPLIWPPNVTLEKFNGKFPKQEDITKKDLVEFISKHFKRPGDELIKFKPTDWVKELKAFDGIIDESYRIWAQKLHEIWPDLCKKMDPRVALQPHLYSLISVPNEFVLPGGRFREFYYWDSYWIIKGLLVSGMTRTAEAMIKNYASIVQRYGFIPNGGRVYYLKRSQPPMLVHMVYDYYTATNDADLLNDLLPVLEKEMRFWLDQRAFPIKLSDDKDRLVFRYATPANVPRPESHREDELTARNLPENQKAVLYGHIASSAESGWDFSSRWFADKRNLRTHKTKLILPADLNGFMCGNFRKMGELLEKTGKYLKADAYKKLHADLLDTMMTLFYNETSGVWFDYHLDTEKHNTDFYPSNLVPMFADCYQFKDKQSAVQKLVTYLQDAKALQYENGVPTSLIRTPEQWDFPNAWPPLIHMIVDGFEKSGEKVLQDLAYGIADRWTRSNYRLYNDTSNMYEKYDVTKTGSGTGGEYEVQMGFGWTNGVILDFLAKYGCRLRFE